MWELIDSLSLAFARQLPLRGSLGRPEFPNYEIRKGLYLFIFIPALLLRLANICGGTDALANIGALRQQCLASSAAGGASALLPALYRKLGLRPGLRLRLRELGDYSSLKNGRKRSTCCETSARPARANSRIARSVGAVGTDSGAKGPALSPGRWSRAECNLLLPGPGLCPGRLRVGRGSPEGADPPKRRLRRMKQGGAGAALQYLQGR